MEHHKNLCHVCGEIQSYFHLAKLEESPILPWCVSSTRNDTFPSLKALEALPGQGLARGSPMGAKGTPRAPKGSPRSPQRSQRSRKSAQRDPKGRPKGAQSHPGEQKGPQSRPKGSQGSPKSAQRKPQARQRHPWEAREARYTFETPDQPHSGRYVIVLQEHTCSCSTRARLVLPS